MKITDIYLTKCFLGLAPIPKVSVDPTGVKSRGKGIGQPSIVKIRIGDMGDRYQGEIFPPSGTSKKKSSAKKGGDQEISVLYKLSAD